MYPLIISELSFLLFIQLVTSNDVQSRQDVSPPSISIPSFTYGYFSQLYPNGEASTGVGTSNAFPTSTVGAASITANQPNETSIASESQKQEFIASMCKPVNKTNQPDMNFPCNKIRLYEYSCIYGLSYQELLQKGNSDGAVPSNHGPKDQRGCFCKDEGPGPQFWQNAIEYVVAISVGPCRSYLMYVMQLLGMSATTWSFSREHRRLRASPLHQSFLVRLLRSAILKSSGPVPVCYSMDFDSLDRAWY